MSEPIRQDYNFSLAQSHRCGLSRQVVYEDNMICENYVSVRLHFSHLNMFHCCCGISILEDDMRCACKLFFHDKNDILNSWSMNVCVYLFRHLFWSVMNTAIINAYILLMESFKPLTLARSKMTPLRFRLELCDQLTAGYLSRQRAGRGLHQPSSKGTFLPMTLFISMGGRRCASTAPS